MCMHLLKYVRLNRKNRLKNIHGTTLDVAMLAYVSWPNNGIPSVYQCVTVTKTKKYSRSRHVGPVMNPPLRQG